MRFKFTLFLIILSLSGFAQTNTDNFPVDWNGYAQIRAFSDLNQNNSFMLRRLKFWVISKPDFSEQWSYKVQTTISSLQQENFFLQDVKMNYKTGLFSFDMGQFTPAYSLEWSQSDYALPIIERAKAVDNLTPSGSLGVRDLGMQANFENKSKVFATSLGVFNGYGIKEYRTKNAGYMLSHKSSLTIPIKNNKLQLGYSLEYRKADKLKIPKVLPDTVLFTGIDKRYNLFMRVENSYLEFQAEYLYAQFDKQQASGYYFLSAINLTPKNQLMLSYELYSDLIASTSNNPNYHIGYNYLFNQNKLKLYFDASFYTLNHKVDSPLYTIQLQIFFK
jgi:hypothetical protein